MPAAKATGPPATAPPPTLRQRALTALFGEGMTGMGIRHTLLQFLSLGERRTEKRRTREQRASEAPRPNSSLSLSL